MHALFYILSAVYTFTFLFLISLEPQQPSSSDHEEGVIPDSPILPSSLPVANKLRKRKDINKIKHVRYAEMPRANKSPFSGQSA